MRARLLCRSGKLKGKDFEITGKLTIGRGSDNSVVLPSRMISGKHAEIVFDGDREQYYLNDLDSLNGTELDGIPVRGRERLDRLHVISFAGAFDFIWQGAELCADLPPMKTRDAPGESTIRTGVEELSPLPEDLQRPPAGVAATERTHADADAFDLPAILTGKPPTPEPPAPAPSAPAPSAPAPPAPAPPAPAPSAPKPPPPAPSVPLPPAAEPPAPARPAPRKPGPPPPSAPADGGTRVDQEAVVLPPSLGSAPEPPLQTPAGQGRFVLVVTRKDRMHRIQLRAGENLVGRRLGAEVYIDSSEVSRRHAVLTVSGSRVRLRDEGSRNHTFVNGEKVEGEVEVEPGAQVRFGVIETLLVYRD